MALHTELWFPTPIWSGKIHTVNNMVVGDYARHLKMATPGVQKSNAGGWQSDSVRTGDNSQVDMLVTALNNEVEQITKQTGLPPLELYNLWININGKGCYNVAHDHIGAVLTGVYYVEAEDNQGNIRFDRSDSARYFLPEIPADIKQNYFNSQACEYKSITNALYIFPAWLQHSVGVNMSDKERISISFNYGVKR